MDCMEDLPTLCKALRAQCSEHMKCLHSTTQLISFSMGLKEVYKSLPELNWFVGSSFVASSQLVFSECPFKMSCVF